MRSTFILTLCTLGSGVRLATRVGLDASPQTAFAFVATPANWPAFVLSSHSVEGAGVNVPQVVGSQVDEVFGLPPLLPLRVQWTCIESDAPAQAEGRLAFSSPSGLRGMASDCFMGFTFAPNGQGGTELELQVRGRHTPLAATSLSGRACAEP